MGTYNLIIIGFLIGVVVTIILVRYALRITDMNNQKIKYDDEPIGFVKEVSNTDVIFQLYTGKKGQLEIFQRNNWEPVFLRKEDYGGRAFGGRTGFRTSQSIRSH